MKALDHKQTGAVLLIALLMLLLLNILTAASISSGNINMQVILIQQRLLEVQQAATNVSNYVLSDLDYFIHYKDYLDSQGQFAPALPDFLFSSPSGQIDIEVDSLVCLFETNISGCSLDGLAPCPQESIWQLSITASDRPSGAQATIIEGVSVKYLPGHCP